MSALAKPNFFSASATNPNDVVNADLIASINKNTVTDPVNSTNNRYEIVFTYIQPYTQIVRWKYTTANLRDTAFTAIKAAIATSST